MALTRGSDIRRATQTTLAELKRAAQLPATIIDETIERNFCVAGIGHTSGVLHLFGLVYLRAGVPITSIGTRTSTTLFTTPTAQWMCLVKQSDLSVLAKTQDKTNEAWAANTDKTFTITGGPYIPTADALAYVGLVAVHGGSDPTFWGSATGNAAINGISPIKAGTSTTGLTDPASLGATAAAITATANVVRGYVL